MKKKIIFFENLTFNFFNYRQKDGTTILDSRRMYIGSDSDGGAELVIRSPRVSDSGLYTCIAQNSMGHTRCSASLRVKGQYKFILTENDF